MVHPVSGAWHAEHADIPEVAGTAVLLWVPCPSHLAVHQQGRAGDARPKLGDLLARHVIGWPDADVIVELPAIGAVLVLIHAVLREMARLLGREVLVLRLHAGERVLDRGIASRQP